MPRKIISQIQQPYLRTYARQLETLAAKFRTMADQMEMESIPQFDALGTEQGDRGLRFIQNYSVAVETGLFDALAARHKPKTKHPGQDDPAP